MAIGAGKYGAQAEAILQKVDGTLCLVLVLGGRDGPAFDVCTTDPTVLLNLPGILHRLAYSIQADLKADNDRALFGDRQ